MLLALVLTAGYMVAEAIGGHLSGSLALLADAGHMLSDAASLALAVFAMWAASRPRTSRRTFGLQRTEILAALVNGATLLAIGGFILVEAYDRLARPTPLEPRLMMAVAGGGLVMNLVCLGILRDGHEHDLNQRGAFLHVVSDALGSVGALISGGLAWRYGITWADPLASAIIAVLVVRSSLRLLGETVGVLLEAAPEHVDVDAVREAMITHGAVVDVHDLHVWTITSGLVCLSAHVVTRTEGESPEETLAVLTRLTRERFGIDHVTIQIESTGFPQAACAGCS